MVSVIKYCKLCRTACEHKNGKCVMCKWVEEQRQKFLDKLPNPNNSNKEV